MDQLSPNRTTAEDPKPPKAAPKADPLPPVQTATPETKDAPKWRTRILMFGLPVILIAAGGYYWLTSGGSVSTDNA